MLKVNCFKCGNEICEGGALVFSPPILDECVKFHICIECYKELHNWLIKSK